MDVGKLPPDLLARLIGKAPLDPRVVVGPRVGEDASVIDFGDRLLVAKTDPITFATDRIGWYAVHINANDLAVSGAEPKWFLASILLPEGASENLAESVFSQIIDACSSLGISLVGGHTEVTYGLDRPIVGGFLLGETTRDKLITSGGARPGDVIILTKGIAIEGTSVLAREASVELAYANVPEEIVERAKNYLLDPGISVLDAAKTVSEAVRVTAMHDPTEGGLITGLREIAAAANVGLEIDKSRIIVLPECAIICKALGLDPMGLIASGSLLFTCSADDASTAVLTLEVAGYPASIIGSVTPASEGLKMLSGEILGDFPEFPRDEIARFFSGKS